MISNLLRTTSRTLRRFTNFSTLRRCEGLVILAKRQPSLDTKYHRKDKKHMEPQTDYQESDNNLPGTNQADCYIYKLTFLVCLAQFAASIYILMACLIRIATVYQGLGNSHWQDIFIYLLVLGLGVILAIGSIRLPVRIKLSGLELTTYGLLGKRIIDISQINRSRGKVLVPRLGYIGRQTSILKISTMDEKSMYIQLGTIRRKQRVIFLEALKSRLRDPAIAAPDAIELFDKWYKPINTWKHPEFLSQ